MTEADENPELPSGYTYLLQLVAHDCVHTPTPFWQIPKGRIGARNGRISRLRLDTLYGLGPFGTAHAYAPDDPGDTTRSGFRLGPMKPDVAVPPLRDIARIGCPADGMGTMLSDPLICDPRNEDNAILAQMTALWHMIHNAFLKLVAKPGAHQSERAGHFTWARAATTLAYRRVLRDDLLPRLLHPAVLARYSAMTTEGELLNREAALCRRPKASVPLEFSHGAMRFAHAMIRPSYQINGPTDLGILDALRASSARGPHAMPLDASWIVRWSLFFDGVLDGTEPANRSLLIRPLYNPALHSVDSFPGPGARGGLAMHDLASAAAAPLWSVPALHEAIMAKAAERGWSAPFDLPELADARARRRAVRSWLDRHENPSQAFRIFRDGDIAAIAQDPPLPFYIPFEAEHAHGGKRLGPLGSILLAEVLYGALLGDPLPGEAPGATLPEALQALGAALGVIPEQRSPSHGTMGALIRFVARECGLEAADPAFL